MGAPAVEIDHDYPHAGALQSGQANLEIWQRQGTQFFNRFIIIGRNAELST